VSRDAKRQALTCVLAEIIKTHPPSPPRTNTHPCIPPSLLPLLRPPASRFLASGWTARPRSQIPSCSTTISATTTSAGRAQITSASLAGGKTATLLVPSATILRAISEASASSPSPVPRSHHFTHPVHTPLKPHVCEVCPLVAYSLAVSHPF